MAMAVDTSNQSSSSFPGLSPSILSRFIAVGDLDIHILEAQPPINLNLNQDSTVFPLVLLLHGFPELAYSWRKIITPLACLGYHVVAPDQRGYGQTITRNSDGSAKPPIQYDDDVTPFRMINLVADVVGLVQRLGYTSAIVIGHDFGSILAGHCALIRPDMFKAVVMMSAPLASVPHLNPTTGRTPPRSHIEDLNEQLALLQPPRKHYTMYFSTRQANHDMMNPSEGLHAFFRAYYHVKSADWPGNMPYKLWNASAESLAQLPNYYVMPYNDTMPQSVRPHAPSFNEVLQCSWLTEQELAVYVSEYRRTGFQGGLNLYRCLTGTTWTRDLLAFSGAKITVPAMFLSGRHDWGVYQFPRAVDEMKGTFCTNMQDEDCLLIDGAGHWVQQEKPQEVIGHLGRFLRKIYKQSSAVLFN